MGWEHVHLLMVGSSIGLSAAVVVLALRERTLPRPLVALVVVMAVAGAAYGLQAGGLGANWPAATRVALRWLSVMGIVCLWQLVRLLFDDRRGWAGFAALSAVAAMALLAPRLGRLLILLMASGLSAHVLWMLVADRRADLDTQRRGLRLWWAAAGALHVLCVLLLNAFGVAKASPVAYATALVAAQIGIKLGWLLMAAGTPSPLARLSLAAARPQPPPEAAPAFQEPAAGVDPMALALCKLQAERILEAMHGEHLYRQPRLSVQDLAAHVRLPEHRLRVVINEHLGYRNFNAFLNHFRLEEAAQRLRSPQDAHLPVLTIALTAGFGSIGPFNRAFREAFGATPTEYRRAGAPALAENVKPLAES